MFRRTAGKTVYWHGMPEKKLIVVAGPTAVGKTAMAIRLAERYETSVISADSRQFYREMNIGTAKPSQEELARVPHHFVNSHSIADDYDAATYAADVDNLLPELFQKKDYVLMCGGSGLYIKAVCEGFDDMPDVPEEIRQNLIAAFEEHGIGWLQEKMRELDPEAFAVLDQQNPHRLIRALEVRIASGRSILSFRTHQRRQHPFTIKKIALALPREELYARIDLRMDKMIETGLFEEARSLYKWREKNALQTVGYQEIFDMMDGLYNEEECIRLLKRNSRRYAKRQLTWFRRDTEFAWFHPDDIPGMITYIEAP